MEENTVKNNEGGRLLNFVLQILCAALGTVAGLCFCCWYFLVNIYEAGIHDRFISHYSMAVIDWDLRLSRMDQLTVLGFGCGAAAVLIGILLVFLAGRFSRNSDGTVHLCWFDRIWTELHLILMALGATGAAAAGVNVPDVLCGSDFFGTNIYVPMIDDPYRLGMNNLTAFVLLAGCIFVSIWTAGMTFLSIVRKLKAKAFFGTSILGRLFLFAGGFLGRAGESFYYALSPRTGKKVRELREGMAHIRAGELGYKIPVETGNRGFKGDLDNIARGINDISDAADRAVQNELKNTRMKTELISNVSHDIKTPLTSIITYIDLLKKEGPQGEHAAEYIDIIDQKSQRLKQLTENLFEAAKAASGNLPCKIEAINLAELVSQALGETDEKLHAKGLNVIVNNKAESSMVKADGQLLWRVIDNLLSNVCKYALDGSRVYIDIAQVNTSKGIPYVGLQVKNISKEQLNITAEELMERFTRGDESRNTDGSGLGLAIAKDLTQLMHGSFDVSVDGDLFKALLVLEQA